MQLREFHETAASTHELALGTDKALCLLTPRGLLGGTNKPILRNMGKCRGGYKMLVSLRDSRELAATW